MKKFFFLAFMAFPSLVHAQSQGCFVVPSNPNECSTGRIVCSGDYQTNFSLFGYTAGDLCNRLVSSGGSNACVVQLDQCNAAYIDANANWKACGVTNDQIRGSIYYWKGLADFYQSGAYKRIESSLWEKV
jgi:hypothetical protein